MDNKTQERIKADAAKYTNKTDESLRGKSSDYGRRISKLDGLESGYIAGATAENSKVQILVDALVAIGNGCATPQYRANSAIAQWKGKEVSDEG